MRGQGRSRERERHHHLHERGPRGREAAAAEGLRPAELNKAASTLSPQLPGVGAAHSSSTLLPQR